MSSLVHETALIPSRLIMEHCMLVAVLHANVGTEVGAFVLQEVVQKFSEEHRKASDDEESSNAINNLLGRYIFIFYHCFSFNFLQSSSIICTHGKLFSHLWFLTFWKLLWTDSTPRISSWLFWLWPIVECLSGISKLNRPKSLKVANNPHKSLR